MGKSSKKQEPKPESSRDINETKGQKNPKVSHNVTIGGFGQITYDIITVKNQQQSEKKEPQIQSQSFFKNLKPGCEWFKNMEKKKKMALIGSMAALSLTLVTLAIVLPIVLSTPNPPDGISVSQIQYNDGQMPVNFIQISKGRHQGTAIATHRGKVQLSYPTVDSITRMVWASNDEYQILFSIPVFSILETFGNGQKQQQAYDDWLADYNADPRKTLNKLIKMIKEKLSKPGSQKFGKRIADNLTLTSIQEETLIDITFDPIEAKFQAVKFDPNYVDPGKIQFEKKESLKKQGQKKDRNVNKADNVQSEKNNQQKEKKKQEKNSGTEKTTESAPKDKQNKRKPLDKDQLMARVMESTIYYIKRVVSRSVQFLRSKSNELLEYQKQIVSESQVDQEWQTVLVNDCKTLQPLRFRCKFDAAVKLDPQLTLEKIQSSNSDYVITQNLNLKFKQVKITNQ